MGLPYRAQKMGCSDVTIDTYGTNENKTFTPEFAAS